MAHRTELNNECYVRAMRSITQAQVHEVSGSAKFVEKKGLAFKPSHSNLVEGIFLFPVILKRKLIFENIKGVYKVLEGCSVKEKRQGKQHLEKTQWQMKHANDTKFNILKFTRQPGGQSDIV